MLGGAAAVSHHKTNMSEKPHSKRNEEASIEASDQVITGESDGKETTEGKKVDTEYNEEQDHLYLFPPPKYQKGDISLGVLMSG